MGELHKPEPRYASPRDALIGVEDGFNYWSGRITESSFQLSVAIIAANWAVFGNLEKIRSNSFALWSIILVLATLGISLLGAKRMSEAHCEIYERCEREPQAWVDGHASLGNVRDPWPFTLEIEQVGWVLRCIKTYLPLIAGTLFVVAVVTAK